MASDNGPVGRFPDRHQLARPAGTGQLDSPQYPPERFLAVAATESVQLVCLQKGVGPPEEEAVFPRLSLWDPGGNFDRDAPFIDTAAIMANLDLVLTSDTAVAHLAGALGVPVWLALPFAPDWRWLLDRADNPWYPSMRLFRKKLPGDWGPASSPKSWPRCVAGWRLGPGVTAHQVVSA